MSRHDDPTASPAPFDATVDVAMSTLGDRGLTPGSPELTIPWAVTVAHPEESLPPMDGTSDDDLSVDRSVRSTDAAHSAAIRRRSEHAADAGARRTRPGAVLESLGPAMVTVADLPALSVVRHPDDGQDATTRSADLHVVSVLGEGGMGRVELARQRSLRREVAVKSARDLASDAAADALLREALFTGYLEHPNIVPVHQLGRLGDGPVLVMKRVDGVSWRNLIHDSDHPAWRHWSGERLVRHLEILQQVCNAVSFAHARGIVHRDVKPENVMLGAFGEVYLMDWGVALDLESRAEPSTSLVGTPAYLAPEMLDGDADVGPWTDVYLLGACLWEVLTGRPPHRGETMRQALVAAFHSTPGPLPDEVPDELEDIVRRAMSREPAARRDALPGAEALREALASYLRHRAARELAERAHGRLQVALDVTGEAGDAVSVSSDGADPAAVRGALAEARFGFREALREWPESPEARDGLQRTLRTQIELELDARNHGLAAALYDELYDESPELARRIRALADELEADSRSRAELHELKREVDVHFEAAARGRFVLAVGAALGALSVAAHFFHREGWSPRTHQQLVIVALLATVVLGVAALGRWSQLRSNRINRQLAATVVAVPFTMLVGRVAGWGMGVHVDAVVMIDLIIMLCFTTSGTLIDRRLKWVLPPALAAPLLAAVSPANVMLFEGLLLMILSIGAGWVWRSQGRDQA